MSWRSVIKTKRKLTAWDLVLLGAIALVAGAGWYYFFLRAVPLPRPDEVEQITASLRPLDESAFFEVPPEHRFQILNALAQVGPPPPPEKNLGVASLRCRLKNGQSRVINVFDRKNDKVSVVVTEGARRTNFLGTGRHAFVDAIKRAQADAWAASGPGPRPRRAE